MSEELFFNISVFLFGSFFGSFANVCIHRLPLDQSIVYPSSRCPFCSTKISFYDNIPILSYLLLLARCRHCRVFISIRYFVVELMTATTALLLFAKYGFSHHFFIYFALVLSLIILSFIDLKHRIIPNSITFSGVFLGLFFAFVFSSASMPWPVTLKSSLLGVLVGGGSLAFVGLAYTALAGREGIGYGDVKLVAMFGAFFGWEGAFFSVFIGSILGLALSLPQIVFRKKTLKYSIPFGPFLSMGLVIYIWGMKTFLDNFLFN